jgi:hypothetical protein
MEGVSDAGGAAPTGTGSDQAKATAAFYLRRELGMKEPVAGAFKATGTATGEVGVHPGTGEGGRKLDGPITTVSLRRQGRSWVVIGARTADIQVSSPKPGATVTSPVKLTGKALAFEGTVGVTVTENRTGVDPVLGRGFVTGSGAPPAGPFSGTVKFKAPSGARSGWLVFSTASEADGQVMQATIVPVRFGG